MHYFFPLILASTAFAAIPAGTLTLSLQNNCSEPVLVTAGGAGTFQPGEKQLLTNQTTFPPWINVMSSDRTLKGSSDAVFIQDQYIIIGNQNPKVPGLSMTAKNSSTTCPTAACPGRRCAIFQSDQNSSSSFDFKTISKYSDLIANDTVQCDNTSSLEVTFCPNVSSGGSNSTLGGSLLESNRSVPAGSIRTLGQQSNCLDIDIGNSTTPTSGSVVVTTTCNDTSPTQDWEISDSLISLTRFGLCLDAGSNFANKVQLTVQQCSKTSPEQMWNYINTSISISDPQASGRASCLTSSLSLVEIDTCQSGNQSEYQSWNVTSTNFSTNFSTSTS